ncbi:hypothetical protein C8R44DRAFT_740106 [Mycena epipterygia]|nr:hypothetical protein C8R44DRAFT_740106 [Mycena epipterygia]
MDGAKPNGGGGGGSRAQTYTYDRWEEACMSRIVGQTTDPSICKLPSIFFLEEKDHDNRQNTTKVYGSTYQRHSGSWEAGELNWNVGRGAARSPCSSTIEYLEIFTVIQSTAGGAPSAIQSPRTDFRRQSVLDFVVGFPESMAEIVAPSSTTRLTQHLSSWAVQLHI